MPSKGFSISSQNLGHYLFFGAKRKKAHKKGSRKSFLPKITLQIEEKSCFLQQNNKCEGIMTIFLETAELRVKERCDLTLDFWRGNVDKILAFHDKKILHGTGSITNEKMEEIVRQVYSDFDQSRKAYEAQLADQEDLQELKNLETQVRDGDSQKS